MPLLFFHLILYEGLTLAMARWPTRITSCLYDFYTLVSLSTFSMSDWLAPFYSNTSQSSSFTLNVLRVLEHLITFSVEVFLTLLHYNALFNVPTSLCELVGSRGQVFATAYCQMYLVNLSKHWQIRECQGWFLFTCVIQKTQDWISVLAT